VPRTGTLLDDPVPASGVRRLPKTYPLPWCTSTIPVIRYLRRSVGGLGRAVVEGCTRTAVDVGRRLLPTAGAVGLPGPLHRDRPRRHSPAEREAAGRLRGPRETAPVGLVPLAWGFATAAHLGLISTRSVFVGHVVMDVVLAGFAALSWSEMRDHPVPRAWLATIVVGFGVTTLGTYAVAADSEALAAATVLGWMALPALALLYTGYELPAEERAWAYTVGGVLSAVAAVAFAADAPPTAAIAAAGVGQTLGILVAVAEY
jgi:hypothetical protein